MSMKASVRFFITVLLGCVFCHWTTAEQIITTSIEEMLEAVPVSLDATVSLEHPGFQSVHDITQNIAQLYGVGCAYERRTYPREYVQEFSDKFLPIKVAQDTTLREYLDHMCSDGNTAWGIVHNAIHIWPTAPIEHKETYLDSVRISLDLQGASLLDAAKAWATEVNKNRPAGGYGVGVRHPAIVGDMRAHRATPESMTRPGTVTLKLDNVTAREAMCAIQGASREWVQVAYSHAINRQDSIVLLPSREDMSAAPEVTRDERQALNEQENLDAVLVEPEAKE